jgi:hypothetical protein
VYKVVKDKLAKTPSHELPLPNTLVIHLRLGDVLEDVADAVRDLLLEQKYYFRWHAQTGKAVAPSRKTKNLPPLISDENAFVKPLSYFYDNLVQPARESQYNHVVLMGASHFQLGGVPPTKSCPYAKALQLFLSKMLPHVHVSLRLSKPPDDDVLFATSADHFLSSGGGYSNLLKRLNQMRVEEVQDVRGAT